jgi:hypothetical protein
MPTNTLTQTPTTTPTATWTPTHTPTYTSTKLPTIKASCDRAGFVSDVTVPDKSILAPSTTFAKTWRLKNLGTCTWTTAYSLVFVNGEKMDGPDAIALPLNIAPGQIVDLTVDLTAPNVPGVYRGNWQIRNASGAIFGTGLKAKRPFWVEIKVDVTPNEGTVYDFVSNVCSAQWSSGSGSLTCPGNNGDPRGFVLEITRPKLENGTFTSQPGLLTFPQNVYNGYIQGIYPTFKVQNGDRFQSIVNCEAGSTACFVLFRLDYQIGSAPIQNYWAFGEKYEGMFFEADLDLSSLADRDVKFILTILSLGPASNDRALWVAPRIVRPVMTSTTTPTPSNVSSP